MWDVNNMEVWVIRSYENVLIIQQWFLKSENVFSIATMYAPCDSEGKKALWTRLGGLINNNREVVVCEWRFQCYSVRW